MVCLLAAISCDPLRSIYGFLTSASLTCAEVVDWIIVVLVDNNHHHTCEVQYRETIFQIIVTAQQEGSLLPATAAQGGKVHLEFLVGCATWFSKSWPSVRPKKSSFGGMSAGSFSRTAAGNRAYVWGGTYIYGLYMGVPLPPPQYVWYNLSV